MRKPLPVLFLGLSLALAGHVNLLSAQTSAGARSDPCRGDLAIRGLPIRKVTIETRGAWRPSLQLPIAPGDRFDFAKLSDAKNLVHRALANDPLRDNLEAIGLGSFSLIITATCVTTVEADSCPTADTGCVDVILRPFALRLDLINISGNTLPIPRSNKAIFYSKVPAPLWIFHPKFAMENDRESGLSARAGISNDLLGLKQTWNGQSSGKRHTMLQIDLSAGKSLNKPFYESESGLTFLHRRTGKFLEDVSLSAGFAASRLPLAEGRHFKNGLSIGGRVRLRPDSSAISGVTAGGEYRWNGHRYFSRQNTFSEASGEHGFAGRILLDGRLNGGNWRGGTWFEASAPQEKPFRNYQKLAVLIGYQNEIGKSEQTIGLEILAGTGASWGSAPAYARFYGESGRSSFLYDSPDAPAMRSSPIGPLFRSFGLAQAGAGRSNGSIIGGTSYWHFNANLAIPIPMLSCPLIPPIALFDDERIENSSASPCRVRKPPAGVKTLKDSINAMVNAGQSFYEAGIADELIADSMSEAEAETEARARAERVFRNIRPAMKYLAQKANLYAVKPLFMLDVGRIDAPEANKERMRTAIGAGVQLTVAVAKLELGYIRTMRRMPADSRGNFLIRFVLQNLF